jgi:hypothetical protein
MRLFLTILVLVAMTATSRAQSAEAELLFDEGVAKMTAGETEAACTAFAASNKLESRAGTLILLGDCSERLRRLASAWSAYRDALNRVKDPEKKQLAEAGVARVEPKLSYLTIAVPPPSQVAGLEITRNGQPLDSVVWNRALPIDGGTYAIVGKAAGHQDWQGSVTVPDENGKISIDVPALVKLPDPVVVRKPPEQPRRDVVKQGTFTGQRKVAIGVAAFGLIAVGGGALLGVSSNKLEKQANDLCPGGDCNNDPDRLVEAQDKEDRAVQRSLYANIAFGVGGAAVVTAVVLWFTGAPSDKSSRSLSIGPLVGRDGSGIDVKLRF